MFKDYYKILEISPDADSATVKAAYRKQALRWHPDRHPNMDVKSIMQDINEAYAILKDPRKRARYDEEYKFLETLNIVIVPKRTPILQVNNHIIKIIQVRTTIMNTGMNIIMNMMSRTKISRRT